MIQEIEKKLEAAREAYLAASKDMAELEAKARAAHDIVKATQKELSDAIAGGAAPCPDCGLPAHGMRQSEGFEVGCLVCGYFKESEDADFAIDHSAYGGLMPKHTVEAWNAGPEFWYRKPRAQFSAEAWAALPLRKAAK